MPAVTYDIAFEGYWRDVNVASVKPVSGVYVVYSCTSRKADGKTTVSLLGIIYIGQADDTCDRLQNHEKKADWKRQLKSGEELAYAVASVDGRSRDRVEAAFIRHHRPVCNTEYVSSFPFDRTTIRVTGERGLLAQTFTVDRAP